MSKIYRGLYDDLYKKWEFYLYRLFQIAKHIEPILKFCRINAPPLKEVLNPEGYNGFVRIPPNPFIFNDHQEIFYLFFEDLQAPDRENDKELKKILIEVWRRIKNIKIWLGMTKSTQFEGEDISNRRLVNEIDIFIKYPYHCDTIYRIMFDVLPEKPKNKQELLKWKAQKEEYISNLMQFKNLLLDRYIYGMKSTQLYK